MPDILLDPDSTRAAIPVHLVSPAEVEAALAGLPASQSSYARAVGFDGKSGSLALLPGADGALAAVLFGIGEAASRPALLAGRLPGLLPPGRYRLEGGEADDVLPILGFALGSYRFDRYRKSESARRELVLPGNADRDEIRRIVRAVALARDLVNTPANDMGPAELAATAAGIAEVHGAEYREIAGEALAAGFPMVHAVGRAATAARAPRLVDFTWGDPKAPKLTLVGKGVCFDTGGLDIKPSSGMLIMKKDMGGAANVLGLASMIMDARLPVRLRVLLPAVENAIAGEAFRPGDILKSRKGLTVEIGNTDAEGRLVLADALALAFEEEPDFVVDLATLTGAARVALGPDLPGVFTGDDAFAADLHRHGERVGDPSWRLPLWAPYMSMLDSKVADINNAGAGGFAGSITAALFLSRFVADPKRWLHGDIYAWTPSARPGRPEGGEAQLIRALYALFKERYGRG